MYSIKIYSRGKCLGTIIMLLTLIALPDLLDAACLGDVNLDGKVDGLDFAILVAEMGRSDCSANPCKSDLNSDGEVNSKDKEILQSEFGRKNCFSAAMEMTENGGSGLRVVPGEADMQEEQPAKLTTEANEVLSEDYSLSPDAGDEISESTAIIMSQPSRFIDNGDGTVTDPDTGLMWTKNANLTGDKILFYQATDYIQKMNRGDVSNFGYTDWRLPTLEELRSLVDYTRYSIRGHELPVGHPFDNVQLMRFGYFSAGSIYFWMNEMPRFFSFYCRLVGHNVNSCVGFVWPVRDGR